MNGPCDTRFTNAVAGIAAAFRSIYGVPVESPLLTSHQKTYHRVFQHPMPHDMQWREVWSMLKSLFGADALEDDKGHLKVTHDGQSLILHRPRGKDLADKKELMQVRHFLERSGAAAPPSATDEPHALHPGTARE